MSSLSAIAARRPGPVTRNGVPVPDYENGEGYHYGAHRPAWMRAAIAEAEAQHGPPVPTCVCGQPLVFRKGACYATCAACGRRSYGGSPEDPG
jgi:hypothetical protein